MSFQLLDEGLQVFPYPVNRSHLDDKEGLTSPPVGMSVTLPDFVIFLETPQVARWDAAGRSDSNMFYITPSPASRGTK